MKVLFIILCISFSTLSEFCLETQKWAVFKGENTTPALVSTSELLDFINLLNSTDDFSFILDQANSVFISNHLVKESDRHLLSTFSQKETSLNDTVEISLYSNSQKIIELCIIKPFIVHSIKVTDKLSSQITNYINYPKNISDELAIQLLHNHLLSNGAPPKAFTIAQKVCGEYRILRTGFSGPTQVSLSIMNSRGEIKEFDLINYVQLIKSTFRSSPILDKSTFIKTIIRDYLSNKSANCRLGIFILDDWKSVPKFDKQKPDKALLYFVRKIKGRTRKQHIFFKVNVYQQKGGLLSEFTFVFNVKDNTLVNITEKCIKKNVGQPLECI